MSGGKPALKPLELRKQLLLLESELNRVSILDEWRDVRNEARIIVRRLEPAVSGAGTILARGIAGVEALRRVQTARKHSRDSRRSNCLEWVKVAFAVWSSFRTQAR